MVFKKERLRWRYFFQNPNTLVYPQLSITIVVIENCDSCPIWQLGIISLIRLWLAPASLASSNVPIFDWGPPFCSPFVNLCSTRVASFFVNANLLMLKPRKPGSQVIHFGRGLKIGSQTLTLTEVIFWGKFMIRYHATQTLEPFAKKYSFYF